MQRLALLYKANPWTIIVFGNRWSERKKFVLPGVSWGYGEIRGGTPPVKVGDLYFTFHHSSLPWKGRYRRYYAGCLAFDAKPPFTPRLITNEPLLIGSQNDRWSQRKPLVVFPCGALYKNETWLVTLGVNDLISAWLELPHKDLFARMQPVEEVADPIFTDYGLPKEKQILSVAVENALTDSNLLITGEDGGGEKSKDEVTKPTSESSDSHAQKPSKKKRKPFSPEALANLRAVAAKARAVRMARRKGMVIDPAQTVENVLTMEVPRNGEPPLPKRRRKRRRKPKDLAERREKAIQEFDASKT